MGPTELTPVELMAAVIKDHTPQSIWTDSPLVNHVRLDKPYRYLLCSGVCPQRIVFAAWRKGLVAEGEAGKLVRMAEGQSITFKLTKKSEDLHPIEKLVPWVNEIM